MANNVSVALCTYNGERFIAEQLRSIFAQSHPVAELVVSDDGSTDNTLEIVRREVDAAREAGTLPAGMDVVILENASSLGVTKNFEQAVRACRYEFIALSDQDDLWVPTKLETLVATLTARPTNLLVFSDADLIDSDGIQKGESLFHSLRVTNRELVEIQGETGFDTLLHRNIVTGATVLFKRDLLKLAGELPASWVHDEWLAMVAALHGAVAVETKKLIGYRQHGNNQIGAQRLTGRAAFHRLAESRTRRNARLLARAQDLNDYVSKAPSSAHQQRAAVQKLAHEQARSAYSRHRLARLFPVFAEWRTGRYSKYGMGVQDVVRDLVQPV